MVYAPLYMPSLVSFSAFLFFIYYLHSTIPRQKHECESEPIVTSQTEEKIENDDGMIMRMLQVDGWQQRMAWQRLQTDLLLRRRALFSRTDKDKGIEPDAARIALAAASSAGGGGGKSGRTFEGFTLQQLLEQEDIDAGGNRRERAKYARTIEERLVDRVCAAFSLAPDTPRAYSGVQVPFTLEEFRDYITGFSYDTHREFRRGEMLDRVRGRRRGKEELPFPVHNLLRQHVEEEGSFKPEGDYVVWATRKYLKYARFIKESCGRGGDDTADRFDSEDEGEEKMPFGMDDGEANSPEFFKMYSPALPIIHHHRANGNSKNDNKTNGSTSNRKKAPSPTNKGARNEDALKDYSYEAIHNDRLANDPHYLSPINER